VLNDESRKLCSLILEHLEIKEPSQTEPLHIIFIGLGLGALVTMQFVLSYKKWIPMGAVLTSVPPKSSTLRHPQFPRWYGKLKEREDEAFRAFKDLLINFNDRCRRDRIRFSCVSLEGEESKQVSRIKTNHRQSHRHPSPSLAIPHHRTFPPDVAEPIASLRVPDLATVGF
jgi:hypothetical protein